MSEDQPKIETLGAFVNRVSEIREEWVSTKTKNYGFQSWCAWRRSLGVQFLLSFCASTSSWLDDQEENAGHGDRTMNYNTNRQKKAT
jgi:hypothetical protein